jgi:beta-lactamase regulating signal transducer with metallopeptidase domain
VIPNLADIAVAVSASVEFSLLVKATLLLGAGLAAARLAARARASVRHVVLAAAFAAVLALPLFATARLDVPVVGVTRDATAGGAPAPAAEVAPRAAQPSRSEAPPVAAAAETEGRPWSLRRAPWVAAARATWAGGAALFLAQLARGLWRVRRLRRTAIPRPDLRAAVRSLAADAGVRRRVDVVTHEEAPLPFTFGLRRPVIVLPPDTAGWDEDDVRRTLVHELEHVRRGDWVVQMAVRLGCAALWFHPLAWAAWRRLCLAAERACDDAVVGREEGADYAEQLVLLARRLAASQPQAVLGMANRSDLSARVSALLDERQPRGRAGALTLGAAVATALAVLLAVAPLRAVPAPGDRARGVGGIEAQARRARSLDRALYEAARRGDTDEVLDLLGQGANPNASLPGDGSPLIGAVRSGKSALVALLLDRGASPDLGVPGDGTALIAAAAAGRLEIVELLLERGAGPDVGVRGDGSPLIAAARSGRSEVVTRLLDRGADIELAVPGDENALIQAAGGGHLEVVKTLVQRGANVNARVWAEGGGSREGEWRTPLGMARRGRHAAVVEFLVASGARE